MKLLTLSYSSSSSPSSSSNFSFDSTFCSSKTVAAGCFTTIFHRIREFHSKFIVNGIDSMEEDKVSESKPSSPTHCKSLNYVPQAFHLLENENFLVFSFESGGENRKFKSKGRRKEKKREVRGEVKRNKREKVNDDGEFHFEKSLFKAVGNGEKVKKRKKGKTCCVEEKVESECSSEDYSPVSVFDFEHDVSGTEEDLCDVDMSWRRKLSPVLENDQLFILHSDSNFMNEEESKVKEIENNLNEGSRKKERHNNECVDIWIKICKLVDDELVSELHEVKRKQNDLENISADFELEILDELLDEVIDQFVSFCL
ncbi:hypothetical protein MTR_5g071090 [Medicago truncatula]|uniref:DNA-directed RNA polymerase n=1 Tax=Medicago truncatula TaxID=3880 RepID=G7JZH9_MEDTR|nr:hypothetical protein MTR_5g071090 [Medicago truncatula]